MCSCREEGELLVMRFHGRKGGGIGEMMYQCVAFRFLEVVASIEWVEPGV